VDVPDTKTQQIRDLKAKGLKTSEILALNIAHRTLVFRIVRDQTNPRGRRKYRRRQSASTLMLEELVRMSLEILRIVRKIAGEPGPLD
jgi:hypothetical protein